MARTPNARPTADGVDPAAHVPADQTENRSSTATDTLPTAEASLENARRNDEAVDGTEAGVKAGSAAFASAEKITVKTTGNFNLMDPFTGFTIDANSEGEEVIKTTFIIDKLASGELEEA
jgi:hypothetical protein